MQNAIADGATKVNDASRTFQRLGLDPEKLMGRNAEEQFRAVARAIMQIGNDTLRTQAEMEVFGRGGKELEGVLRQVASGVADSYKVMTDAQVYAMNRLAGSGPSVMNQVGGFTADVVEKDTRAIATLMLMATQGIGWTKALRMVTEDQTHAMEAQAKAANDDAAATRRAQQEQAQYAAIKKAGEGRQAFQLQTDQMAHLREEGFAASGAIVSVAHEAQAMIDRLVESVGGKLTPAALEAIKGIKQAAQARAEELRQQKVAEAELARDTAGMNPIDRQHVQVAREYGNSVADRVAALARQTLGTDKAAELELKIKLVGLSEAQKQMAEFVHQGGAPAAADAIGRLAVKFDELSQVRDIGLRAHAAEVGDFQAKLDELAAGGWSREFVQKYRDAAEAIQAHELKMQFDPEERLREELRRIEQVRGKLDDATYGRARQKANDDYLRETHQEPGKLFGGAAVKGSEDAYKIIYDAMADQWQGQRQVDLLAAIDEKMGQLVAAKNDPTSQGMSEDTIPIPP
jgi:hypothetical protein